MFTNCLNAVNSSSHTTKQTDYMIPICMYLFFLHRRRYFPFIRFENRKKQNQNENRKKQKKKTQTCEQFNESLFQWKIILVAKQYNVTHLKSVLHETDNIQLMVPKLHIPH